MPDKPPVDKRQSAPACSRPGGRDQDVSYHIDALGLAQRADDPSHLAEARNDQLAPSLLPIAGRHRVAKMPKGSSPRQPAKTGGRPRVSFEALDPSWQEVRWALCKDTLWYAIVPIVQWACDRKLDPSDISETILAECVSDLEQMGYPRCHVLSHNFRRAVALIGPGTKVALPYLMEPRRRTTPRKDEWQSLTPALRSEIEAMTAFKAAQPSERKMESAAVAARNVMLRALAVARDAGHVIATLRDMTSDDVLRSITSHASFGPIDEPNASRSLLLEILRRFLSQRLEDEDLVNRLTGLLRRFPLRRSTLSKKGLEAATLFDNIEYLYRLKSHCRQVIADLAKTRPIGAHLNHAQYAIGICLIVETASKPRFLKTARFAGPPSERSSRPSLVTDCPEAITLESNITARTSQMIDDYFAAFQTCTGRAPIFLFETSSRPIPKASCTFANGVARIGRDLKLPITPSAIAIASINLVIRAENLDAQELKELTRTRRTSHFQARFGLLLDAAQMERSFPHGPQ